MSLTTPTLAVILLATVAGCGDAEGGSGTGAGGGSTGATSSTVGPTVSSSESIGTGTGGGGGDGGAGDAPQIDEGLFACDLPLDCGSFRRHLYPEGQLDCLAQAVLNGVPLLVETSDLAGGATTSTEARLVLIGDGTLIRQRRFHDCEAECEPLPPLTYSDFSRCDVVIPEGLAEACEADPESEECGVYPGDLVGTCESIPDESCEEIALLLE